MGSVLNLRMLYVGVAAASVCAAKVPHFGGASMKVAVSFATTNVALEQSRLVYRQDFTTSSPPCEIVDTRTHRLNDT